MKKLVLIFITLLIFSLSSVFAATDLLSCGFKSGVCSSDETVVFYANENFFDSSGKVISSNIAISSGNLGYTKPLCCKINPSLSGNSLGSLEVNFVDTTTSCPVNSEDLMYLTSNTNSRVGVKENITNFSPYLKKMCVKVPTDFSKLNIFVSSTDYSFAGYSCLFRLSNVTNGLVSDCSASFNGNKYGQIIWAKLTENVDSLKCNADCTSKLDGRVYEACGAKIAACKYVSPKCDGSVYGAYVNSGNYEVQCSAPWTNVRNLAFTNEQVEVTSINNKCSNIIQRKYSVMLNNELVTMSIYVCGEE